MTSRIIFPRADGGVCVLMFHLADGTPLTDLPIGEIARKDVPPGVPFRIIDESDIPADRSRRELWTADFSNPDGHGIGAEAWFAEQVAREAAE